MFGKIAFDTPTLGVGFLIDRTTDLIPPGHADMFDKWSVDSKIHRAIRRLRSQPLPFARTIPTASAAL